MVSGKWKPEAKSRHERCNRNRITGYRQSVAILVSSIVIRLA
jgi:hypothetical protein